MLKKQFILNSIIIFIIFFLDRLSKFYILNIAENEGTVNITINSFLNIILVWNSGIGFGLLQFDQTFIYNLITILIAIINVVIIYLLIYADKLNKFFFSIQHFLRPIDGINNIFLSGAPFWLYSKT